jgi:hypothetical protein
MGNKRNTSNYFGGKTGREESLGKSGNRWYNNIKIDLSKHDTDVG